MKSNNKKLIIILSIAIAIFSISVIDKTFQNDTFFNISIGKHILENGIDMKEPFCWVQDNLDYSYSHWAFDIIIYLIFSKFSFTGIYIFTIIFTAIIGITLFLVLSKRSKYTIIPFAVTLLTLHIMPYAFTARSQIISFLCFIVEIFCIEQFIETKQKRYGLLLILQAIIIANFHAATWPLILVLFLPYVASGLLNIVTFKNIRKYNIKKLEKKINSLPKDSPKINEYQEQIEIHTKIINEPQNEFANYKIVARPDYYLKGLIILMLLVSLTGLLTPIHGTPYTYIIKSMFGPSNFEDSISIDYVNEMQPLIPLTNIGFIVFIIILLSFLLFLPTKLKREHGFLILGLLIMALSSRRYCFLLVLLGSFVLVDLITQTFKLLIPEDLNALEKLFTKKLTACCLLFFIIIHSVSTFLDFYPRPYVDENMYPVAAVEYIKKHLDYKNIKIFNSYNNGSYLMLNDIPVFIDSRLDVYCSEFNDTDIFYDYIQSIYGNQHYEDAFSKYGFTHILIESENVINKYICKDPNYVLLHSDDAYCLYERTL